MAMETGAALLKLGTTVVTFVAKRWMGDASLASGVTTTLSQIFETKLTGVLAQRRAARQFDTIAERIAETLSPLLEVEFGTIDADSRQVVIDAVNELLESTPLDGKILLAYDLDPSRLERHFAQPRKSYLRDFSANEVALFDRLLSECCQYVVDLSSRLPRFSEHALSELLARESALLQRLDEVIETAERIRHNTWREGQEARGHFDERYRRAVIRLLDRLELVGVDVSRESGQHQLSVAYVSLAVSPRRSTTGKEEPSPADKPRLPPVVEKGMEFPEPANSVERALISGRRLVIAGLAGAGKTTLLKWIAVQTARGLQEGALATWKGCVPFLVRLRQFNGPRMSLPSPEAFAELLAPEIAGLMPRGWAHDHLQAGTAVVLVDGVDEVPESDRAVVRSWLGRLMETFPDARYIITSRPHAIKDSEDAKTRLWSQWIVQHGFAEAELLPMSMPQIEALVQQWHEAVALEFQDADTRKGLPQLAQRLIKRLRTERALHSLAETPLLCAVICALHHDRRTHLPRDKVSLYEKCCELLLDRRDQEREISLADYPDLSLRDKSALVEDLAYYLMKNRWSEVDTVQADRRLARTGGQLTSVKKKIPGKSLRRLLVERCGLLLEPAAGRLAFAHRTFQEYLAARAAVEEGDYGVLLDHALEDLWKEVIVLAAGIAKRAEAEALIKKLVELGDRSSSGKHRYYALAIACCESARRLSQQIRTAIDGRLKQLPRPTNQDEAKAFAAAGDHAVPYLGYDSGLVEQATTSCVNTLGLIGTESALEALEAYAGDKRWGVSCELFRAWEEFPEKDEYAQRVLKRVYRIGDVLAHCSFERPISSLRGVEHFTQLQKLEFRGSPQLTDLRSLRGLLGLTHLTMLGIAGVKDLSPVAALRNLAHLRIEGAERLEDLSPVAGLDSLKELSLNKLPRLRDCRPITQLPGLRELELIQVAMEDLSQLLPLKHLQRLYVARSGELPSLQAVGELAALKVLELGDCTAVKGISAVKQIEKLKIFRSYLPEVSFLKDLGQLERLWITASTILSDISPLEALDQLSELVLFNCRNVKDLAPLAHLKQLKRLVLPVCSGSTDLAALGNLQKLKTLQIAWTDELPSMRPLSALPQSLSVEISLGLDMVSLEPLLQIPNLTRLTLSRCPQLVDISPLASLSKLEVVTISDCPRMVDLTPLERAPALKQVTLIDSERKAVHQRVIPAGLLDRVRTMESKEARIWVAPS